MRIRTGLRRRTDHPGRHLAVGGAVLRPRAGLAARDSVVASDVSAEEHRRWRADAERAAAQDPGRLFIADATLTQSRSVLAQLGRAADGRGLVTRDAPGHVPALGPAAWRTQVEHALPGERLWPQWQHAMDDRQARVEDSGGARQPGEVRKRPNPTLGTLRVDEPSEARPYKRRAGMDYLALSAALPEPGTAATSVDAGPPVWPPPGGPRTAAGWSAAAPPGPGLAASVVAPRTELPARYPPPPAPPPQGARRFHAPTVTPGVAPPTMPPNEAAAAAARTLTATAPWFTPTTPTSSMAIPGDTGLAPRPVPSLAVVGGGGLGDSCASVPALVGPALPRTHDGGGSWWDARPEPAAATAGDRRPGGALLERFAPPQAPATDTAAVGVAAPPAAWLPTPQRQPGRAPPALSWPTVAGPGVPTLVPGAVHQQQQQQQQRRPESQPLATTSVAAVAAAVPGREHHPVPTAARPPTTIPAAAEPDGRRTAGRWVPPAALVVTSAPVAGDADGLRRDGGALQPRAAVPPPVEPWPLSADAVTPRWPGAPWPTDHAATARPCGAAPGTAACAEALSLPTRLAAPPVARTVPTRPHPDAVAVAVPGLGGARCPGGSQPPGPAPLGRPPQAVGSQPPLPGGPPRQWTVVAPPGASWGRSGPSTAGGETGPEADRGARRAGGATPCSAAAAPATAHAAAGIVGPRATGRPTPAPMGGRTVAGGGERPSAAADDDAGPRRFRLPTPGWPLTAAVGTTGWGSVDAAASVATGGGGGRPLQWRPAVAGGPAASVAADATALPPPPLPSAGGAPPSMGLARLPGVGIAATRADPGSGAGWRPVGTAAGGVPRAERPGGGAAVAVDTGPGGAERAVGWGPLPRPAAALHPPAAVCAAAADGPPPDRPTGPGAVSNPSNTRPRAGWTTRVAPAVFADPGLRQPREGGGGAGSRFFST